jgi:hypothetical protein
MRSQSLKQLLRAKKIGRPGTSQSSTAEFLMTQPVTLVGLKNDETKPILRPEAG